MITLLNKTSLFSTFGVKDFDSLELAINNMAPSMVEYYLSDLSSSFEEFYLNKRNIEKSISFGEYSLYMDYDENISLEFEQEENIITNSLW